MKSIKKAARRTLLIICLVAAVMLTLSGINDILDNADVGIFDAHFMNGVFFAAAGISFVVMTIEKLIGGSFRLAFEKKES